jgi:hypothetical protein
MITNNSSVLIAVHEYWQKLENLNIERYRLIERLETSADVQDSACRSHARIGLQELTLAPALESLQQTVNTVALEIKKDYAK